MFHSPLRTILIHPYPVEREALQVWFGQQSGIDMIGSQSALSKIPALKCSDTDLVVVFDYGIEALPTLIIGLKKTCPSLRFLTFRDERSVSDVRDIVCAGVDGLLDIASDTEEWYGAVRAILRGRIFYCQQIMQILARTSVTINDCQPETDRALSTREMEILSLVAREYSTSRIAEALFISIKTVETHRRNLFQKLQVRNVVGLTKVALRMGVLG